MTSHPPTHGGNRKGAGRPRKPRGEKFVKVTVALPPLNAATAQLLGGSTARTPNLRAIRRGIVLALERRVADGTGGG